MLYHINLTRMLSGAKDSLPLEKRSVPLFTDVMIFLLVYLIASAAQGMISSICTSAIIFTDPEFYDLIDTMTVAEEFDPNIITEYINKISDHLPQWFYVVIVGSSGLFIPASLLYCKLYEKRKAYTLGFSATDKAIEYFKGIGIGLIMIATPALVCKLTGCVVYLPNSELNILTVILFAIAFVLQGMGEEVLFRGYLLTSLARKSRIWPAIITSSLAFAAFHTGNAEFSFIAFLNIFLFGVFASVYMLKRGSIWGISAIHTVWNFVQGNILGFNVSGNPKFETVLEASPNSFGSILHGGDFGLEGGLGVTVILLIALLLALIMPTKKSELVEEKNDSDAETVQC